MTTFKVARGERGLALKFAAVSLIGFATDATVLHVGLAMGVPPAWGRIISLFSAMQVTFAMNALLVFRCLDLSHPWRQWAGYMVSNGFGNFCNYWIFVTLVSLHRPVASVPLVAVAVGSFSAWMINYASARLLVFRNAVVLPEPVTPPCPPPNRGHGPT